MNMKAIETADDAFEYIQTFLCECINDEKESVIYNLEEITEFGRGRAHGAINVLDDVRAHIRNLLKHGYSHLKIEDWSGSYVSLESESQSALAQGEIPQC